MKMIATTGTAKSGSRESHKLPLENPRAKLPRRMIENVISNLPNLPGHYLVIKCEVVDAGGNLMGRWPVYSELEHLKPVCGHFALPSTCGHAVLKEVD